MSDASREALAGFAVELADAAGPIARRYFRGGLEVIDKADESPVTLADRTIEARLRELIQARYPDHGIAGEEYGLHNPDADLIWSLDPIDGTKAFITGRQTFGTLIGLLERGAPLIGVIDCPAIGDRWIGGPDLPTRHNGKPVTPPPSRPLAASTLCATSPDMFEGGEAAGFGRLRDAVKLTLFSGDCHNFGLLASGWVDLVVESGLKDYDYLAPAAVIEGAGGRMTDWEGRPLTLGSATRVVAARTPALHAEALERLAG